MLGKVHRKDDLLLVRLLIEVPYSNKDLLRVFPDMNIPIYVVYLVGRF